MKLKTSELIDRFQSLSNISHDKTTGRIAMAIMSNIKALEELYKATLQTIEDTKVKYADKDDSGNPVINDNQYQITSENLKKLQEELQEINEQEIEVPDMTMLPMDAFDKCEEITPVKLYSIEFMISH